MRNPVQGRVYSRLFHPVFSLHCNRSLFHLSNLSHIRAREHSIVPVADQQRNQVPNPQCNPFRIHRSSLCRIQAQCPVYNRVLYQVSNLPCNLVLSHHNSLLYCQTISLHSNQKPHHLFGLEHSHLLNHRCSLQSNRFQHLPCRSLHLSRCLRL